MAWAWEWCPCCCRQRRRRRRKDERVVVVVFMMVVKEGEEDKVDAPATRALLGMVGCVSASVVVLLIF